MIIVRHSKMLLFDFIRSKYIVNDKRKRCSTKTLLNDKEYGFGKTKKNQWWSNCIHVSHSNSLKTENGNFWSFLVFRVFRTVTRKLVETILTGFRNYYDWWLPWFKKIATEVITISTLNNIVQLLPTLSKLRFSFELKTAISYVATLFELHSRKIQNDIHLLYSF